MTASGDYLVESDVDNWNMPIGLGEEFATGAVAIGTDIITVTHDIPTGTEIWFTTTSALPTGLLADTLYYAKRESATTIKVCNSPKNAAAGTAIDITDVGSGTHTIWINYSQTFATMDVDIANDKITLDNVVESGVKIRFSSSVSTPDLPAPIIQGTTYYAIATGGTAIAVALTPADAAAVNRITLTDVGSGTHTIHIGEGQSEYDRQQLINRVEELINKLTNDYFVSTAFVVYRNGNDKDYLDLGFNPDVLTVTEIKISGIVLTTDWWTYNSEAVYLNPESVTGDADDLAELHLRLRYERNLFPKGIGNIKITGTYGWSSIPARVKQAAVLLCKAENDSTLYSSYDSRLKSEKLGDYSYTLADSSGRYSTGIDEIDDLLKEYIRKKPIMGAV